MSRPTRDDLLLALGRRLLVVRIGAGLTLRELADAAGCDFTYLSKIENGRVPDPPSDALLERIEMAVGDNDETLRDARARWVAAQLPERVLRFAAERYATRDDQTGKGER